MTVTQLRHEVIPPWTVGWKLKRALDFAGISAQEMAAELGVHVGTVSRWMNDREMPRRAYLMAWALRTGVSLSWLADESGGEAAGGAVYEPPPGIPAGMSGQPEPAQDHPRSWDDLGRGRPPGYAEVASARELFRKRLPLTPLVALLAVAA